MPETPSTALPSFLQGDVEWERKPRGIDANLRDYDEACRTFRWEDVEREFSWSQTGKVNVVFEAIDRHADGARGNKVALYYTGGLRNACRKRPGPHPAQGGREAPLPHPSISQCAWRGEELETRIVGRDASHYAERHPARPIRPH